MTDIFDNQNKETNLEINPINSLKGICEVQGDKSISHRAIMIGALTDGTVKIINFLESEDTFCTARAYMKMGVNIKGLDSNKVLIHGVGTSGLNEPDDILDLGNSGTSMRLLLGVLSGQPFYSVLTGDRSLCSRPMKRVTIPLQNMGATVLGRDSANFAPLTVLGKKLNSIEYKSKVASAQVKSSLLLAGLFAKGKTVVIEPSLSRDHSERMLTYFGADIKKQNIFTTSIKGNKNLIARDIFVPGDISSAAYFIVGALILENSLITIKNVGVNPTRTGIIDVLKQMGGNIELVNHREQNNEPVADIKVCSSKLTGIEILGDIIPRLIDEIPVIAIAAACAKGITIIKDASELRVKESDRIKTISMELSKLGVKIKEQSDGMIIQGGNTFKNCKTLNSHYDHRIAMSLAIAGLKAKNKIVINNTGCIDTSFPKFNEILKSLTC